MCSHKWVIKLKNGKMYFTQIRPFLENGKWHFEFPNTARTFIIKKEVYADECTVDEYIGQVKVKSDNLNV